MIDHLVKQAAVRGLLELTYCIDSTDVGAISADQDASKCDDPTLTTTTVDTADDYLDWIKDPNCD